jgi:hypothetical protein
VTSATVGPLAGIGRFLGQSEADLLVWDPPNPIAPETVGNGLEIFYFGSGGVHNHSRQDMR